MHRLTPEWPYKHLSVKSTRCTLNTNSRGPNFNLFRSTMRHFRDTDLLKIGIYRMTQNMPFITEVSKVPYIHWILTLRPKFHFVSLYHLPFSRYRFSKIGNAPNHPRMTLITEVSKIPCVNPILTQGPNFTPFRSTVARFPDSCSFWFPHRVQ